MIYGESKTNKKFDWPAASSITVDRKVAGRSIIGENKMTELEKSQKARKINKEKRERKYGKDFDNIPGGFKIDFSKVEKTIRENS